MRTFYAVRKSPINQHVIGSAKYEDYIEDAIDLGAIANLLYCWEENKMQEAFDRLLKNGWCDLGDYRFELI